MGLLAFGGAPAGVTCGKRDKAESEKLTWVKSCKNRVTSGSGPLSSSPNSSPCDASSITNTRSFSVVYTCDDRAAVTMLQ